MVSDSEDDDQLVYCDACGDLWHQHCHRPVIHPLPPEWYPWFCCDCVEKIGTMEVAARVEAARQAVDSPEEQSQKGSANQSGRGKGRGSGKGRGRGKGSGKKAPVKATAKASNDGPQRQALPRTNSAQSKNLHEDGGLPVVARQGFREHTA